MIKKISGFQGEIVYDRDKPDGTPRKLLDITKLTSTGWKPKIPLDEGVASVYHEFSERAGVS